MKKHFLRPVALAVLSALGCTQLSAQSNITADMLRDMEAAMQKQSPEAKAIRNALSRTSLKTLATDASTLGVVDADFSNEVPIVGITNQQSSGRCWLFTGMNVLRSKAIIKHNLKKLELSQVYLFFYDQLEKSNLFLQGVIDTRKKPMDDRMVDWLFQNPLSDGGTFTGVADLVTKYGVVPKEAMPETYSSNNTSAIASVMKLKLREFGLDLRAMSDAGKSEKQLIEAKKQMLGDVYRMLTLAYGIPPKSFTWTCKTKDGQASTEEYTPMSFYQKFWDDALTDNYVMVMNDPSREYHKVYQINYDRHTYDGHDWLYVNLPIDEIKPMAIASIKDSTAMYFSCDVGKFLDSKNGTLDLKNYDYGSIFGLTFGMDKKQRVMTHASGSSHAMTLIAVDVDPASGQTKKWMVENSWGAESGHDGKLIMTDEWFNEYMFRLVLNKKYVPESVMKLLSQKPILLPAWDPMFTSEQ